MSRLRVGPAVGVGLIWAFLILFLVYPLGRIFYDAVTDEAGRVDAGELPRSSSPTASTCGRW